LTSLPACGKLNQAFDFLIPFKIMIQSTTSIDSAPRDVRAGEQIGKHQSLRASARAVA
jgi:hypothetical protein